MPEVSRGNNNDSSRGPGAPWVACSPWSSLKKEGAWCCGTAGADQRAHGPAGAGARRSGALVHGGEDADGQLSRTVLGETWGFFLIKSFASDAPDRVTQAKQAKRCQPSCENLTVFG